MMDEQRYLQESDEALNALFASYRAANPDPEPSVNFMPQLWQKIEARERTSKVFTRWTRNLVTAALALTEFIVYRRSPNAPTATPAKNRSARYRAVVRALRRISPADRRPA